MLSCFRRLAPSRAWFVLALCSYAATGMAQVATSISPSRKVEVRKAVVQNTYDIYPQIRAVKGPYRDVEQNEREIPPRPAGKSNGLIAGQIAKMSRIDMTGTLRWPAIGATGWVPPDPTAAVGPDYVVVTVNSDLAFFSRSGTKLFQQGFGDFFTGVATVDFIYDPKCFYDPLSKRFFVLALEQDGTKAVSGLLLAVSASPDPRGNWLKYRIDSKITSGSTSYWLDYPGFGYNKDRVVISGNMFGFSDGYAGIQIFSLDKKQLIAGTTSNSVVYNIPNAATAQWCKTNDSTSNVLYGATVWTGSSINLLAIQNTDTTTGTLKTFEVQVPGFRTPNAARSTSGHLLDALDGRLLTMGYQGGHIVAAHGVRNMTKDHAVARWYDFVTNGWPQSNTPKLNQSGEVAGSDAEDCFMPAVHINAYGDIGMVFSRSSSNITADMMVTGRKSTDAKGVMGTPNRVSTSDASYGGSANRWGDYFSVEVDPKDSRGFWAVGMVGRSGAWYTQVWNWSLATNGAFGSPYDAIDVGVYQGMGQLVSGTARSLVSTDGNGVIVSSARVSGSGQAAAPIVTFGTDVAPATVSRIGINIAYSGPVAGSVIISALNLKTGKYDPVGTAAGSASGTAFVPFSSSSKMSSYIAENGQVIVVVRYLVPIRNGAMPNNYQFKLDQARLMVEVPLQ